MEGCIEMNKTPLARSECLLLQRRGRDGQLRFNQDWPAGGKKSYHFDSWKCSCQKSEIENMEGIFRVIISIPNRVHCE